MLNRIKEIGKANFEILSIGVEFTDMIFLMKSTALVLFLIAVEGEDCLDASLMSRLFVECFIDEHAASIYNKKIIFVLNSCPKSNR